MLTFEKDGRDIVCTRDEDDGNLSCERIVEAMANSIEIDVTTLENEGAPVFLGNAYAEYQLRALTNEGEELVYGVGPNELKELRDKGFVTIRAYQD